MLHPSLFIVQGVRSIGKDGVRVRFFLGALEQQQEQQPQQLQLQLQRPLAEVLLVGAARVGLRDTLQVPLRGPAQPLAAVRSVACEAVPRKQCAFTHVSS
ncbi:hypothetical protein [Stenotrophomonas sp. P5_B8]